MAWENACAPERSGGRRCDGDDVAPGRGALQAADAFFAATKATIRHGGEMAFYHPSEDFIKNQPPPWFTAVTLWETTRPRSFYMYTQVLLPPARDRITKEIAHTRARRTRERAEVEG